jgi:pyruvate-formate lyase-activating enzyme
VGCRYLERGLSFSYHTVRACAIIHHGRGSPVLAEYTGGPLPLEEIQSKRAEIQRANENDGYPECRLCPHLNDVADPPASEPSIDWLGITHFIRCNIECDYCWLQWAEWSPRQSQEKRVQLYDVAPAILELIEGGLLAPDAVIDWGGGGEPTIMPEFDDLLARLDAHGTTQWIHTNAVHLPAPIRLGTLDGSRLQVLCSVDAGTAATYERLKGVDRFEAVWRNLATYQSAGAALTLKYLVEEGNTDAGETAAFVERCRALGVKSVVSDIDHRYPDPTPRILRALARLQEQSRRAGIYSVYGSTGARSALEFSVGRRVRLRALGSRVLRAVPRYIARKWSGLNPEGSRPGHARS